MNWSWSVEGGSLTAAPCKEESKELRVRKDRTERLRTDISGIPRVTRPSHMGFSFTLPPRTNYSLSCRSGYFRLLAETQHNGLIHRVTCRVFGDALLLGPFPCRLRWREAVAHSQPWFQTPAMKASSSSSSGRSEGPLAGSRAADDWLFLSAESAAPQHLHTAADEHEVEDKGKLKSKLVSAWNSVKYGLLTVLYFFFLC